MKGKKRILILSILGIAILIISGSYAYFLIMSGENEIANIDTKTHTVDEFNFKINGSLGLNATPDSLPENGSNLNKEVTATARLKVSDKNEEKTYNYYLYLRVNKNDFVYTKDNTPEVVLKVTKPDNTPVTNVSGLSYDTTLGFDLTTVAPGTYLIASDTITSSDSTKFLEENWLFTLSYLNLNFDQSINYGHTMSIDVLMTKEVIGG